MKKESEKKRGKRANGMGCLFKRGNMWWGKFMCKGIMTVKSLGIHVQEDGMTEKELKASAEAKLLAETAPNRLGSEIDALLFLKAKIESMSSARKVAISATRAQSYILLKDACQAFRSFRERKGKTGDTTRVYLADLAEFVKWRGANFPMASVTQDMADRYVKTIEEKRLSPYTFNRKISALRLVWESLGIPKANGGLNPWADIATKKHDTVVRDTLSNEEIEKLKNAAGGKYGGDLRMLIVIGEFTGLRLSDAATLRWSEIDFKLGIITKQTGKTGAIVHPPILPEFAKELAEQKKRTDSWDASSLDGMGAIEAKMEKMPKGFDDYVVPRMAAKALKKNGNAAISVALHKVFKEAKVESSKKVEGSKRSRPVKGFHSLRATWVTRL